MAELFLGKPVQDRILLRAREMAAQLPYTPKLAALRIGARDDDIAYERSIAKRCADASVAFLPVCLPADASEAQICDCLDLLNGDEAVHGVLLFAPLPREPVKDMARIRNRISHIKDVDGISDASLSRLFLNKPGAFAPSTAEACMEVLRHYRVPLSGAEAVVVGRSFVVGRPLAAMLLQENATVTVCHTRTADLEAVCRRADVLVAAAGVPQLIGKRHVRPGQVVLDVGVHALESGELCGDVDADEVLPVVRALTPVPRGIGAVTTAVLILHVTQAAQKRGKCI